MVFGQPSKSMQQETATATVFDFELKTKTRIMVIHEPAVENGKCNGF